jgi:hypothetical protein
MTRFLIAIAMMAVSFSAQAQSFVQITKNKASYTVGETAQIRMRMLSIPESPGYEFYLSAKKGATPVEVKKVTDTEFYSLLPSLTAGNHSFAVETYLQDKQLAAAFNQAIANYDAEIALINDLLEDETDPQVIEDLEAERAFKQSRKAEVSAKLTSIRRKVDGPVSIQISVN